MADIFDIMIYESGSGGDFNLKNDDLETISGLTNQVYLALFGGNIEENSITSDELDDLDFRGDWFGNEYLQEEFQFNSLFERTLTQVALNSQGISTLEDAASQDLEFLTEYAEINIEGSIPEINKFQLVVQLIEPNDISTKIKFIWDATKNELIETIII